MATTVSQANQDKITMLKAKLQFVTNKLNGILKTKATEVETANTEYKDTMQAIDNSYATQIDSLQTEITNLKSQLEAVK